MNNIEFLAKVSESFRAFLESGTSRTTNKLKPLHGSIAEDIFNRLNKEASDHKYGFSYEVSSQGYADGKEDSIDGRYYDKKVDITIFRIRNNVPRTVVGGVGIKFVQQNYSQNSNNYFENMLGETANIRTNNHPYFQVFVILDKLPYYNNKSNIKKWETFTDNNVHKYIKLSYDNPNYYYHTPDKLLIYCVNIPNTKNVTNKTEYINYYKNLNFSMKLSKNKLSKLGSTVIYNDYEMFIDKVCFKILSL